MKRKRPEQTGQLIGVRLQPNQLAALDAWAAKQGDSPTRPEAVRRLMAAGLNKGAPDDQWMASFDKVDR